MTRGIRTNWIDSPTWPDANWAIPVARTPRGSVRRPQRVTLLVEQDIPDITKATDYRATKGEHP